MICQSCFHECHSDSVCNEEVYLADREVTVCKCNKCSCSLCSEEEE